MKDIDLCTRQKYYKDNLGFISNLFSELIQFEIAKTEEYNAKTKIQKEYYLQKCPDESEEFIERVFNLLPTLDFENEYEKCMNNYQRMCLKDQLSECKEEIKGISLSNYLQEIRNNDYESLYVLVIENDSIIDSLLIKGQIAGSVKIICPEYEKLFKKYTNANFYEVHNHPRTIPAIPSEQDICAYSDKVRNLIEYPRPIDWGVVTPFDYYSHAQSNQKSIKP